MALELMAAFIITTCYIRPIHNGYQSHGSLMALVPFACSLVAEVW